MNDSEKPDTIARLLFWSPLLLTALGIVASVLALPHLPERMPIHWGIDGEPTRFAASRAAAFFMVFFMAHAWLMVGVVGWAIAQTGEARRVSPRVMPAISTAVVAMLLLMHLAILANSMGWNVPVPLVATAGAGLLFVVVGHKMRRLPQNPIIGVRTPTTLHSPAAWRSANEVGGRGFMYAGVATLLAAPLPAPWPIVVLLGSLTLAAVAAVVAGRRAEREAEKHV